ncbi:MAG: acyl-CoA thioesterase [Ignavibacteriaceae bacterium]
MDIKDFKHSIKIKVRFSDLDAMRHVNNATYLSYLEEARIAYFKDVLNKPKNGLDFDAVVARIEIDYQQPIILGDEVEILTRVSKLGNKSSDVEDLILVERNGAKFIAAAAVTKLVSYDYEKQISFPTPESIKKKIEEFEKGGKTS